MPPPFTHLVPLTSHMPAHNGRKGLSKETLTKSSAYTSKLRSATPMDNDIDTWRIRARLDNYGTPKEIAEEGYRVCRLNASLRRDLEEAQPKLAPRDFGATQDRTYSSGSTADVTVIKEQAR
jgi:hypothetical protein